MRNSSRVSSVLWAEGLGSRSGHIIAIPIFRALFSDMWLQELDDKDDVMHRVHLYHQVGWSFQSFQFIVRLLFFCLPCFTEPFLPWPILVSCVCVPLCSVHCGSCVCASAVFPCIVVPVFALRSCSCSCSCSGVLIPRPCIVLAFPSRSFSWARDSSTTPDSLGSVRHISQLYLVMFGSSHCVLLSSSCFFSYIQLLSSTPS
ncbi:hypothetical protein EV421DRAFT_1112121 [Armillaria borealis]|uniref:Uncharacterized protein n=1 Tax=Armillaria borealis TaxID=47425 RepID=A0AA39MJW2_9AGAR|nr:hypothetical protein EV421DRAFT_1112121 [Armillaria borealis]